MTAAERFRVEATIERLIAMLDADDGDSDLEPEEDRCAAEDDAPVASRTLYRSWEDEDAEPTEEPLFGVLV